VMLERTGAGDGLNKISISYLPKGFYFLKIVDNNNHVYIEKIVRD
jgi:hypothetical protein